MSAKIITPDEIFDNKETFVHQDISEIVNQFLGERYTKGGSADILQKEIVEAFLDKNPVYTEEQMLKDGLLDFEDAYRKNGWHVEYDKPVFYGGDSFFDPFYRFRAKTK